MHNLIPNFTLLYSLQRLFQPTEKIDGKDRAILAHLTDEHIKKLTKICMFDDMKDSNYENGAVAETIGHIKQHTEEYILDEIDVRGKILYLIVPEDKKDLYKELIENQSYHQSSNHMHYLKNVVENIPIPDFALPSGWIDLGNHAMFFTDQAMAQAMSEFLTIKEAVAA